MRTHKQAWRAAEAGAAAAAAADEASREREVENERGQRSMRITWLRPRTTTVVDTSKHVRTWV